MEDLIIGMAKKSEQYLLKRYLIIKELAEMIEINGNNLTN